METREGPASTFTENTPRRPGSEGNSGHLGLLELSRLDIKKPTVEGRERLPQGPSVIATTHLSDIDVQEVAAEVARDRKIGIASQASNLTAAIFRPFIGIIGKENFFPLSNTLAPGGATSAFRLTSADVQRMSDGIVNEGRTMVVSAHKPVDTWQLPDRPGLAAVVLAHRANVPLVPVALDIESERPVALASEIVPRIRRFFLRQRPSARMIIGEQIPLSQIPKDQLDEAINLYSVDKRRDMSQEQLAQARQALSILQQEATQMMRELAAKLPEAKRGKWSNPEYTPSFPQAEVSQIPDLEDPLTSPKTA